MKVQDFKCEMSMRHWPKNRLSIEVALMQLCNWVGGRIGGNRTMEKRITRRRGGGGASKRSPCSSTTANKKVAARIATSYIGHTRAKRTAFLFAISLVNAITRT